MYMYYMGRFVSFRYVGMIFELNVKMYDCVYDF